jgi:hypothetical protein
MVAELSILELIVKIALAFMWLALGLTTLLWFAMVVGLFRDAVALISSCERRAWHFSAYDRRFLRDVHIHTR